MMLLAFFVLAIGCLALAAALKPMLSRSLHRPGHRLDVVVDLTAPGFHRYHIVATDRDPGPQYEVADLLWLGEGVIVLRCMAGPRVILREDDMVLGEESSLRDVVSSAEERALAAEHAALEAQQNGLETTGVDNRQ